MKNINRITRPLIVALLLCPTSGLLSYPKAKKIESRLLSVMDGHLNIVPIIKILTQFQRLKSGKMLVSYNGQTSTLEALSVLEQGLATNELTQKVQEELGASRQEVLDKIHEITLPFRHQVNDNKERLRGLVVDWIAMRERNNTMLLRWFDMPEEEFMLTYLQSFRELTLFLDDFMLLLADVKESLPHSMKNFEDMMQKMKAEKSRK